MNSASHQPQKLIRFLPRNRVLRHILFWIWVYLLDAIVFGIGYENIPLFLKMALLEMPGQMFFAYTFIYWILPRYVQNRNVAGLLFYSTVSFLLCGFIVHILFLLFQTPDDSLWNISKILLRALYCFLKACIAILVKLALMWQENENRVTAMEKTKLQSELKLLKDQVNPHFLFNTLNNLYGLIARNSLHAQESVLRLSGILHFMLHESNRERIPLQQELRCIQDYIELEKLRYDHGAVSVALNVQDNMDTGIAIAPLVIFPFVENAFKHGASEIIRDAWINIDFSVYKNDLVFKIANSKSPVPAAHSNGIGLSNVKRRLELVYGNDHSLQITDEPESYLVILKIALNRMTYHDIQQHETELSYR